MLLFSLFLGIVCGIKGEEIHDSYQYEIDNGILKSVKRIGQFCNEDDLSNLGIRGLQRNVFDEIVDSKSINLAGNLLEDLPEFVFSNLSKLEKLSLANNNISKFNNAFVGLDNVKILNISNNSLRHLRKSYFFGLNKSTDIITNGNELWSISTAIFENPFLREPEMAMDQEMYENNENITVTEETKTPTLRNDYNGDTDVVLDKLLQARVCKTDDGTVKSVKELKRNETISVGCSKVRINYEHRALILRNLGIRKFEKGWYKLHDFPINSIDLSNNEISEITPEILNDLPSNLPYVNLAVNKIMRLKKGIIENENLKVLNFKDNLITEIENNALEETSLSSLFVNGNKLKSLDFVASLPTSLHELIVSRNQIKDIHDDSFVKLENIVYLNLAQNNITSIRSKSLRGLSSLQVFIMTRNQLSNIEKGSFNDLMNLGTLYLYQNSIRSLESGVWNGLENLKDLNLAWNKFEIITNDTFFGLPLTLRDLHVDYNEIRRLEIGSFNHVPKSTLSLDGNKISEISEGTFHLPNLQELHLKNNSLERINGAAFEGLPRLRRLSLNANRIKTIENGAAKHMGRIQVLDLSKNPIECLKNGALFGLPKSKGSFLYVSDTPLSIIQGGVFEDV